MTRSPRLGSRLRESLRFDGLWWRKFARSGSVYAPQWFKQSAPAVVAAIIFVLVGHVRRGAVANMARVVGAQPRWRAWRAAFRMTREFAHCITETMEYFGPQPRPITLDLQEHDLLAEALREGHGAIIVTAHFGNWDVAAKSLRKYDRPVNVVMARETNATTREYVRQIREQAGVRVLYSDTSVLSSLSVIRALQRNEIVAIQLDRMLGATGGRLIPFFGAPALFPSGPFLLARLSGAPVIAAFAPRLGPRRYVIRLGGRFNVPREARDSATLDRVMSEVVQVLEGLIREFPTQWFQFAPFWPPASAHAATAGSPEASTVAEPLRVRR